MSTIAYQGITITPEARPRLYHCEVPDVRFPGEVIEITAPLTSVYRLIDWYLSSEFANIDKEQ